MSSKSVKATQQRSSMFSSSSSASNSTLESNSFTQAQMTSAGVSDSILDDAALDAARPVHSLVGAKAGDGLNVANQQAVEERSVKSTHPAYDHFSYLDAKWSRGINISADGQLGMAGEKNDAAALEEVGVTNMSQYQAMLRRDFNFGKIVSRFAGRRGTPEQKKSAGEAGFLDAVLRRFYPDRKRGDEDVEVCLAIAKNIWSYATVGADIDGNTDIAEMQGLLYVFDKQISEQSDLNTNMEDEYFIVPGTEDWTVSTHGSPPIKIRKGDGDHGRATTLTTRHLLADMTSTTNKTEKLTGYDESHLLIDNSGSMTTDEFPKLAKVLAAGGIDGDVAMASYSTNASSMEKVTTRGSVKPGEQGEVMNRAQAGTILGDAGRSTPLTTPGNQLGVARGATEKGQMIEQGLDVAFNYIKELPEQGYGTDFKRRQVIIFTDEPDASPHMLPKLQAEAQKKDVSVKAIYSFNNDKDAEKRWAEENPAKYAKHGAPDQNFVVIDLLSIDSIEDEWLVDREGRKQLYWDKMVGPDTPVHSWADY